MSEITAMDSTRHVVQDSVLFLVACAGTWVFVPMVLRLDLFDIAPVAFILVPIFSILTGQAARAGNRIAMTISLAFMVGLLGLGSAGALTHSGIHLSAIADLAAVWLMSFMALAVQLTWLRHPSP
jgi:dipeptide/tripeptide permease